MKTKSGYINSNTYVYKFSQAQHLLDYLIYGDSKTILSDVSII